MTKKLRNTGRSDKADRHIRIYYWLYDTPAWQDLEPLDVCIYLELLRRYAGEGSNNGYIPLSVREVSKRFRVGKSTAARGFRRLQDHGFIAVSIRGTFAFKNRHATEWRLTAFSCDATHVLPTKEFTRWKKSDGPTADTDGSRCGTLGMQGGTVADETQSDSISGGTVRRIKVA